MAMDPLSTSMPMYDPRRSLAVHNILHNQVTNQNNSSNGNASHNNRTHTTSQSQPDSTVPSPPAVQGNSDLNISNKSSSQSSTGGETATGQGDTLADLANSEISLDLQGLIDDAHFGADAENLFGDLIDNGQVSLLFSFK